MKVEIDIPEDEMADMHVLVVRSGKYVRIRLTEAGVDFLRGEPAFLVRELFNAFEGDEGEGPND